MLCLAICLRRLSGLASDGPMNSIRQGFKYRTRNLHITCKKSCKQQTGCIDSAPLTPLWYTTGTLSWIKGCGRSTYFLAPPLVRRNFCCSMKSAARNLGSPSDTCPTILMPMSLHILHNSFQLWSTCTCVKLLALVASLIGK